MRAPSWVLAVVLVASLFVGCVGSDGTQPASTRSGEVSQSGNATDSWDRSISIEASFLMGNGIPFYRFGALNGCHVFGFEVPANTTRLTASVSSQVLNTSRPGFGDATLLIAAVDGEDYHPSDGLPPGGITIGVDANVNLTVNDPASGEWSAIVWPNGLVVNQAYPLTVHLEGNGSGPPGPLEFEIPDQLGRSCEENGILGHRSPQDVHAVAELS